MQTNAKKSHTRPLETAVESPLGGLIIYALIGILLVAIILLPPISAAERVLSFGYADIPTQEGGFVTAEDGAQLMVLPEGIESRTKNHHFGWDGKFASHSPGMLIIFWATVARHNYPQHILRKSTTTQYRRYRGINPTAHA